MDSSGFVESSEVYSSLDEFSSAEEESSFSSVSQIGQKESDRMRNILLLSRQYFLLLITFVFFSLSFVFCVLFTLEKMSSYEIKTMTMAEFQNTRKGNRKGFTAVTSEISLPNIESDGFFSPPLEILGEDEDITDVKIIYNPKKYTLISFMSRFRGPKERPPGEEDEDIREMRLAFEKEQEEKMRHFKAMEANRTLVVSSYEFECEWHCENQNGDELDGGTEIYQASGESIFRAQVSAYDVCLEIADRDCFSRGWEAIGVVVFPTYIEIEGMEEDDEGQDLNTFDLEYGGDDFFPDIPDEEYDDYFDFQGPGDREEKEEEESGNYHLKQRTKEIQEEDYVYDDIPEEEDLDFSDDEFFDFSGGIKKENMMKRNM